MTLPRSVEKFAAAARLSISAQQLIAAEDARAALVVARARGERRAAGAADRVVEREVVGGPRRRLGELDVVDDRAGARLPEAIDGARVAAAAERPLRRAARSSGRRSRRRRCR